MTKRSRKDLPVPAAPEKKTFSPRSAHAAAACCSDVSASTEIVDDVEDEDEEEEDDEDEEDADEAVRSFCAAISLEISDEAPVLSENAAAAAAE